MDEDNNNSYDDYPRESVADGSEVDYREAEENDDRRHERRDGEGTEGGAAPAVNKGNNLYVTNLAFETTDESLRAAFAVYGEVLNSSVVKEPVTLVSRGFGFVNMADTGDAEKAIEALNGGEVDGRAIKVERARRATGYEKTPGRYLGPPGMSTKRANNRDGGYRGGGRDGGYRGGNSRGYDRDRDYERGGYDRRGGGGGDPYDRGYDRGPDRYARGGYDRPSYREGGRGPPPRDYPPSYGGGGGYRESRGDPRGDPRSDPRGEPRDYPPRRDYDPYPRGGPSGYDSREERGRGPPPAMYDDRERRAPPRDDYPPRGRSPPPRPSYASGAYEDRRGPPPRY